VSGVALEAFLARLYVDPELRRRFLEDPAGVAAGAGLAPAEQAALAAIDRQGLGLAARSFAAKRASAPPAPRRRRRWLRTLLHLPR
jgi:hypothetical protein